MLSDVKNNSESELNQDRPERRVGKISQDSFDAYSAPMRSRASVASGESVRLLHVVDLAPHTRQAGDLLNAVVLVPLLDRLPSGS